MTLAEDLVEGAALLPDVYAASGMSIVLSGADSLVFRLFEGQELYDRCTLIHTTPIPYHESERVLGISGIDEHIRHGGSMCPGERRCGEGATFETKATTDEYIDTAITGNIRH